MTSPCIKSVRQNNSLYNIITPVNTQVHLSNQIHKAAAYTHLIKPVTLQEQLSNQLHIATACTHLITAATSQVHVSYQSHTGTACMTSLKQLLHKNIYHIIHTEQQLVHTSLL
jgi:hypothetical protein